MPYGNTDRTILFSHIFKRVVWPPVCVWRMAKQCLRSQSSLRRALSSNRHRADECASGQSGIADELSEAIVLREVKTLVRESFSSIWV